MPRSPQALLQPRKSPVQARSSASVQSILEATVQVLLAVGKERLTTTRVAYRAGVSVGTLYQYFPNKQALLQAALREHLNSVASAVERACAAERSKPLVPMVTGIANAFLDAKLKHLKTSSAFYAVSSDVEGWKIAHEMGSKLDSAIVATLRTTPDRLCKDAEIIASMVQATMAGVSRRLLESRRPAEQTEQHRAELIEMLHAYLATCIAK